MTVRPSDTTGIWAFVTFGVEFRGSSLKVFVELIERLKNLRFHHRKPGYFLEDAGEVMFADISRSTGLCHLESNRCSSFGR